MTDRAVFRSGVFGAFVQSHAAWLATLILAALTLAATGEELVASELGFSCTAVAGVSPEQADLVCHEFQDVLQRHLPDIRVQTSDILPRLDLTVQRATERSVALDATWVDANGAKTPGTPLRTSFFDRNADTELRKLFFVRFLDQNPFPF